MRPLTRDSGYDPNQNSGCLAALFALAVRISGRGDGADKIETLTASCFTILVSSYRAKLSTITMAMIAPAMATPLHAGTGLFRVSRAGISRRDTVVSLGHVRASRHLLLYRAFYGQGLPAAKIN